MALLIAEGASVGYTVHNVLEYHGDLLNAKVDGIIHQCNCVSTGAIGLAKIIFKAHPEANGYRQNPDTGRFGEFNIIFVDKAPYRAVVNLYTQLYPGVPGPVELDTAEIRLEKFGNAIRELFESSYPILSSFAFPKGIGCGYAGGNWNQYRATILDVASQFPFIEIHIVEKR